MQNMLSPELRGFLGPLQALVEGILNGAGNAALRNLFGPLKTFMERLNSKNGRLWWEAFKRFLRREQAWIQTYVRYDSQKHGELRLPPNLIQLLKERNVLPFDGVESVLSALSPVEAKPTSSDDATDQQRRQVVEVRVCDLVTLEEGRRFTYADVLKKASECFGLEPCPLSDGLYAALEIVIRAQESADHYGPPVNYVICCKEVFDTGDHKTRVPLFWVWPGKREGIMGEQGSISLYDFESRLETPVQASPARKIEDPETRLLFQLIL